MIKELSDLGKKLRKKNSKRKIIHNALKEEDVSIVLTINQDGQFLSIKPIEKKKTMAEAILRTSGKKPRLLVDNIGYVLGFYNSDGNSFKNVAKKSGEKKAREKFTKEAIEKLTLFKNKLLKFKNIKKIDPVLKFYFENGKTGIKKITQVNFEKTIENKMRNGNVAFLLLNENVFAHEYESVYQKIIEIYESEQIEKSGENIKCSICGKVKYPVTKEPHEPIKKVPDGQSSGCALVSYNARAFESYGLAGNLNSKICTNCAKTYSEGLNWLMSNGKTINFKTKKGKEKQRFQYSNRKNFGSDTAIVFWTRSNTIIRELDLLDETIEDDLMAQIDQPMRTLYKNVHADELKLLLNTPGSGKTETLSSVDVNRFYACTLSGAAARIAIRDWVETNVHSIKNDLRTWFNDIVIQKNDFIQKKSINQYTRIYNLARSCQNNNENNETTLSRVAIYLWNAAIKGTKPPIWILNNVLKRIRIEELGLTPERAALIKLILNRNNKGGVMIQEKLDTGNKTTAYVCGRIFAVLESIQRAALGKNINAGIRERFFSFASTSPSSAFGRLMKLSQNHLSKLKSEKPGFAVILDKELQELFSNIKEFPVVFSLEEQGQFAIGYYHQKQDNFRKASGKEEYKEIIEEEV